MSYTIKGNEVIFKNLHFNDNIRLRHAEDGYKLIFNSDVVFNKSVTHQSYTLGKFTIELANSGEELAIKKNGQILFKVAE